MRILVTGGSGVLGRVLLPLLRDDHDVVAPARTELDLFDAGAVGAATRGAGAVYHLATRIPPRERMDDPAAWAENDRLRATASRILVDAALAAETRIYIQPTIAFATPPSALAAEEQAMRFAAHGRVGVVLRLGLLYGPGTGTPRAPQIGATLHVDDAGRALAAALDVPSGIYNVTENDNPISNADFNRVSGWTPQR